MQVNCASPICMPAHIYLFHKYMLFITAYWTTATTTCNDHISDETNTMFGVVLISGVVDMCMSNKNFG